MDSRVLDIFYTSLRNDEIHIFYQPKVSLKDYSLKGAEALCRWFMNGFIMMPDDFIPTLESGNAICDLDFYILEKVCQDIKSWLDDGLRVVKISVNLSRRHLDDPEVLSKILKIIDKYEVPHKYIEIELTETTTEVELENLTKLVNGLHNAGIITSVDDFGIGYSSMRLIRELPWDVIKLDKSFLPSTKEATKNQFIMLKAIIDMATDMGMECVCEGVETLEHIKILKEYNCYTAQGFYFDHPMPAAEFVKRLSM